MRKLSSINGSNVSGALLDRAMYNVETLPPLGKEYWWFLFYGQNGEKPIQLMLLIFRKYGKKMLFNDKEIILRKLKENKFHAVTAGWIYDGEKLHDLGDTNAVTKIYSKRKAIISEISGKKMVLSGGFPNYRLKVGNAIDLEVTRGNYLVDKDACGVFIFPFGMAWVDAFLNAKGTVLGKNFKGTAHLQKVVGVAIFGSFHWGRIIFQNGFSTAFFCLKTGKNSKIYFRKSLDFHDHRNKKIIKFDTPALKISKRKGGAQWIVEGRDGEKYLRMVLETYATKRYAMTGGGSQVYIEYAVVPKEFILKTKNQVINLDDLGKGVGTLEDAYGSPI